MAAGTVKANSKPWMRLSAFPGLFRCGQIAQWLLFITFMEIAVVLLQESCYRYVTTADQITAQGMHLTRNGAWVHMLPPTPPL